MMTKIVHQSHCDCNSDSSICKTKKNRACCGCQLKRVYHPHCYCQKSCSKKESKSRFTPTRRSNRCHDQDKKSRSTKMKPQVLDLTASVSPKKKPPGGKLNEKVMAAPSAAAATTVAKKGKREERNSLLPPAKRRD